MSGGRQISRRSVLAGLGATGAIAAGGSYLWARGEMQAPGSSPSTTSSGPDGSPPTSTGGTRTLVVLEMLGGNDSLSTVVPHADGAYHDLRPSLAIDDPIDLDGEIGLAPALTTLAGEYAAGHLAVVHGVGVATPDLSHFASRQLWWTANAGDGGAGGTGWLGRYVDTLTSDDPLVAISVGASPAPALTGTGAVTTSIADARGLVPALDDPAQVLARWAAFATAGAVDDPTAEVRAAIGRAVAAGEQLDAALAGARASGDDGRGGRKALGIEPALELAAWLAVADPAPRVVHVSVNGDFDTHVDQVARHTALMEQLDAGIAAYLAILGNHDALGRVALMTTSEFGRRPAENGSGTDHGTAAAHLVLGGGVRGGRHGDAPSLRSLDADGNLVATVDHRDYFASVLRGWLDADVERALPGATAALDLFA
jgi:uncharacterized protein (DUF1501 family)